MQKATYKDAELIARSMSLAVPGNTERERADRVWDIIRGLQYNGFSELTMAVLICLKPLPVEKLNGGGANNPTQGGVR